MKIRHILLTVLAVFCFSSCGINKYVAESVDPQSIKEMALLHPVSEISIITSGNKNEYSESMSATQEGMLERILMSNKPQIPISQCLELNRDQVQSVYDAITYARKNSRYLDEYVMPADLLSLVRSTGQRYALLVVSEGFSNSSKNYWTQAAVGLAAGILAVLLSPIIVYSTPVKAITRIDALVVDSETGNVVYYRSTGDREFEPLDEKRLDKVTLKLFKNFTW